jgi:hypothetical protein
VLRCRAQQGYFAPGCSRSSSTATSRRHFRPAAARHPFLIPSAQCRKFTMASVLESTSGCSVSAASALREISAYVVAVLTCIR